MVNVGRNRYSVFRKMFLMVSLVFMAPILNPPHIYLGFCVRNGRSIHEKLQTTNP